MLVTVVIPTYNVEKYIEKCLESIFLQSYKNIEILIINDCSTDNSLKIIKEYINTNETNFSISIIDQKNNNGPSISRNIGINNAKGDYIFFMDSDDRLREDAIELMVESALYYNSDVVIPSIICYVVKEKKERDIFPLRNNDKVIKSQKQIFEAFIDNQWPVSPCKLYSKKFLKENQLFFEPGILGEDELWSFKWAQKANIISFINENLYFYLLREKSIISSRTKKNFEDMFFILDQFQKEYNNEKSSEIKYLIKKHILYFKEIILMMQWRDLSKERKYFYFNYGRLKNTAHLTLKDLLSNKFSITQKKKSILLHLPTFIGAPFYIKRYER